MYDKSINGYESSGGMANADNSLIKHNALMIDILNKKDYDKLLDSLDDTAEISIQFQIGTKSLNKISFNAYWGKSYLINITGDNQSGYKAVLK